MRELSDLLNNSDDSISSCHTFYSDEIHSDIEAELYSIVHYESLLNNTQGCFSGAENTFDNEPLTSDRPSHTKNQQVIFKNTSAQVLHNEHFISDKIDNNELHVHFEGLHTDTLTHLYTSGKIDERDFYNVNISPVKFEKGKLMNLHKQQRDSLNSVDESQDSTRDLKNLKVLSRTPQACEHMSNNNRDTCQNTLIKTRKKKYNNIAFKCSDTDSDSSVILIGDDDLHHSNLTTNMFNEQGIVSLSSNFSDDLFCSVPRKKRKREVEHIFTSQITFKPNISMPNIKLGENKKDLWHVDDEDLYRSNRFSGRYHANYLTSCTTCKQKGHTAKNCNVPRTIKCYLCGGGHVSAKCKNRMCPRCFKLHFRKKCLKIGISVCSHCNMNGHEEMDCPDLWRRYHLTTSTSKIIKAKRLKQDTPIYCFNCGIQGHFGANCRGSRMNCNPFPTWPSVISYDNPYEFYKKSKLDRSMNSPQRKHVAYHVETSPCGTSPKTKQEKNRKKGKKDKVLSEPSTKNKQHVKEPYFPRTPPSSVVETQDYEHVHIESTLNKIKPRWKPKRAVRLYSKNY